MVLWSGFKNSRGQGKGQVRFDAAGGWKRFTVTLVGHRQTKGAEQIGFTFGIPRHPRLYSFVHVGSYFQRHKTNI